MARQLKPKHKARGKRISKYLRRDERGRKLRFETFEARHLLAGFLQGYAFIDANNNNHQDSGELPKVGAMIELRSADGTTLLDSTTTDSTGYYRFDGKATGTYQLVEIPTAGNSNQGTEFHTTISTATQLGPGTLSVSLVDPDAAPPVTIERKPGLPGALVSFTVAGGPFNAFTQPDDVHQFQISINSMPDIYSFCTDLFHANPASYSATPSTVPGAPGLATNIGQIGYLYNTFGTQLLSPTNGAGLSVAIWELIYDASPDLSSGNFSLGPAASDAAAVAAANSYLALSAGQDQRAIFLNVLTPTGDIGDQGMIATEYYNFANVANKSNPTINTVAGGTIVIGSGAKLNDTAVLSGGFNPTGTITFTLYNPSNVAVYTDVVTVSGNGSYDTSTGTNPGGYLPTVTGTYTWTATYSGDANNNGATDNGVNENEVVSPTNPAINTVAGGTIVIGSGAKLNDTAVLSGGFNPTGTITFTLYNPSNVAVYTDVVTVSGNGSYDTSTGTNPGGYLPTVTGTYTWTATYSGDVNNNGATDNGVNENEVVSPTNPTINTVAGGTIVLGSGAKLNDTAVLSGGFNPTGTITFTLYNPSNVAVYTDVVTVSGNGSYDTSTGTNPGGYLPTVTGTYTWTATYSGDVNNNGATDNGVNENEVVSPTNPAINTVAGGTIVIGSGAKLNDTAVLSGGFNPTGTITFTLYNPSNVAVYTDVVTVSGNSSYDTSTGTNPGGYLPTVTGTYTWTATYSGDANNNGATDNGVNENEVVSPTNPAINTVAGGTIVLGSGAKLTDTAVLSGGYNPTGTITFTLYNPSNVAVYTDVVTVSGNGTYTTATGNNPGGYLPTVVGTYLWTATYSGDSKNTGALDNGVNENEIVVSPGIDIEKTTNGPTNSNPVTPNFDNEDAVNGPGVPVLTSGSTVTWTYKVTNTGTFGSFAASDVVVTDDNGTPGNTSDDLSTTASGSKKISPTLGNGTTTANSTHNIGDLNNNNFLDPGEAWYYTASGTVLNLTAPSTTTSFNFTGSTAVNGAAGNIRSYTSGALSVNASAFSRNKSTGAWATAYLGAYGGGLGVTDTSEDGTNNSHTVDNSGRDNYVLFEFSDNVIVDAAFLGYVVGDSDMTVWIGNATDPFNNHQTLSDSFLSGLGFTEVNFGASTTRSANLNAGSVVGNVLVIAAKTGDSDDMFKVQTVTVNQTTAGSYENKAVVTVNGYPGLTDSDLSHYKNPAPTGSISGKKYADATGNGFTSDDAPLAGVTVYIDANGNKRLDSGERSTTTGSDGSYQFTGLMPGTYTVREVLADGWVRTAPTTLSYYSVSVTSGHDSGGNDFANFDASDCADEAVEITNICYTVNGGTSFTDLRGNTNQGDAVRVTFTVAAGVMPPHQLTLVSYTAPGPVFDANTASQQQVYDFETGVFGPGTYSMDVRIPNSYYQIDFICGPLIDHFGPAVSGIFYSAQGRLFSADNDGTSAVLSNGASLSGMVFVDGNKNNVKDLGEVGIGSAKVTLAGTDYQNNPVSIVEYTKSDGTYLFGNLKAGKYAVTETQPSGFSDGLDYLGSLGGTLGNDVISNINVAASNKGINYDFGEKLTTLGSGYSAGFQVDTSDSTKAALVVNGTSGTDVITVTYASSKYNVTLDGTLIGSYANKDASNRPVARLVVNGGAGNDDISVDSSVTIMTELNGGEGHDRLVGGGGYNILVGGNGTDTLIGGSQVNMMIGGNGADVLVGGAAGDLTIAGSTSYDTNATALRAIFAEWTSARDYATRMSNILGTGSGTRANGSYFLSVDKVFDDGESDRITGAGGRDWLFGHLGSVGQDIITDLAIDEVVTDVA